MRIVAAAALLSMLPAARALGQAADPAAEMQACGEAIRAAMKLADPLRLDGKLDESIATLLAAFPEGTRTPVQALVLGNILFSHAPKISYELHQAAAKALPTFGPAQLEWAMEQHRAKQYAGAAASYAAFTGVQPDFAAALGAAAECEIRLDHVSEAVALWDRFEKVATGGHHNLEQCIRDINGPPNPEIERARLVPLATKGDSAGAAALILLDSSWNPGWWHAYPASDHLKHDTKRIHAIFPQPDPALNAALCVGACAAISDDPEPEYRAILAKYGFIIDDHATLPASGQALETLLYYATTGGVLPTKDAREQLGERILAQARASKDVACCVAAADVYSGTDRRSEIEREAWKTTHHARFAASLLKRLLLETDNNLSLHSPEVEAARAEFPENSDIAWVVNVLATAAQEPKEPFLVAGIKAEYTQFSHDLVSRDSGIMGLRSYFQALGKLRGAQPPAPK